MSFDPVQFKACLVEMQNNRSETLRALHELRHVRDEASEKALENELDFLGELIAAVEASTL